MAAVSALKTVGPSETIKKASGWSRSSSSIISSSFGLHPPSGPIIKATTVVGDVVVVAVA